MNLDARGKVVDFAQLEPGSIFVTDLDKRQVVRMMKAFVRREDGHRRDDLLVTIGPFTEDDKGVPGIYDPRVLGDRPVLDISAFCSFLPSLDTADLIADPPSYRSQNMHGVAFVTDETVLLAARNYNGAPHVPAGLLDLASGELTFRLNHDRFFATRRWRLVAKSEEREVLFDFPQEIRKK